MDCSGLDRAMRTIKCEKCNTGNTVDSKFCRHCGVELPAVAVARVVAENEQLVSDGRRLLTDGRSSEAKLVAESVLESDPLSVKALSLLGDAYEKEGKLDEAVGTYEQVVELAPESSIDKIRLAHLRKLQATTELAVEVPVDRRRNLTIAVLSGVLLLSVASALVLSSAPVATKPSDALVASADSGAKGFRTYAPPMVPNVPTSNGGNPTATTDGTNTPVAQIQPGLRNPNQVTPGYSRPAADPGSSVPPWNPFPNGQPTITPSNGGGSSTQPNKNQDPDPNGTFDPNKNGGNNGGTVANTDDPGVVEITVVDGNKNQGKVDGGASVDDKSAEVLIQKARNLYLQGDYAGAAGAYEQAIRAGSGGGATYQRLAQCYEKIGRKGDAISAYRKAASSYEAQIQRGQGNSRVQTALDACKRAISALGG